MKQKTRIYSIRFPELPKSRFEAFKEIMDAYAKKVKKQLTEKK